MSGVRSPATRESFLGTWLETGVQTTPLCSGSANVRLHPNVTRPTQPHRIKNSTAGGCCSSRQFDGRLCAAKEREPVQLNGHVHQYQSTMEELLQPNAHQTETHLRILVGRGSPHVCLSALRVSCSSKPLPRVSCSAAAAKPYARVRCPPTIWYHLKPSDEPRNFPVLPVRFISRRAI